VEAQADAAHEHSLARKSIGFWEALSMSIEAMGPLLGALAVAPLIVSQAGFSAPFMILVCGVAITMVALTIGRFSRVLPSAASIYTYISHGLGEKVGFLSAWLSYMYYFLFEPLLLFGFGLFANSAFSFVFGVDIAWYWWSILAAAITFALSIIGIKLSMRIDLALALIADVALLIVSLAIIGKVIADGNFTLDPLTPTHAPAHFTGLSLAIAFGVLIFLGFEQSFTLGEEVRDPHGDVPKAIYTALGLMWALLFISCFAMVIGFGASGMGALNDAFGTDGTPYWKLIDMHLSTGWRDMLQLVTVVSILGNTIASHNAVVRIEYGMGRARALPSALGWTHRKFKTPYVAILVQTGLSLAITLFAGLYWGATKSFGFLGFLIGLAAAVAFILILLAALRYFPRERPQDGALRNYVLPLIGIVILAPVVYTSFYPDPGYPLKWAPYVILGWLVAGVVYLGWRESRREHIDIDYAFREIGESPPDSGSRAEPA
jgi:amino acid transporter